MHKPHALAIATHSLKYGIVWVFRFCKGIFRSSIYSVLSISIKNQVNMLRSFIFKDLMSRVNQFL